MTSPQYPDIQPLLVQRLREAMIADGWPGTDAELDAEVEALVEQARAAGRRIREAQAASADEAPDDMAQGTVLVRGEQVTAWRDGDRVYRFVVCRERGRLKLVECGKKVAATWRRHENPL